MISKDIKTIGRLRTYKRPKNSQKDFIIEENVKIFLQIPMNDSYFPITHDSGYSERMSRVITENEFDKIKIIDWSKSKTDILNEIETLPHMELLKIEKRNFK